MTPCETTLSQVFSMAHAYESFTIFLRKYDLWPLAIYNTAFLQGWSGWNQGTKTSSNCLGVLLNHRGNFRCFCPEFPDVCGLPRPFPTISGKQINTNQTKVFEPAVQCLFSTSWFVLEMPRRWEVSISISKSVPPNSPGSCQFNGASAEMQVRPMARACLSLMDVVCRRCWHCVQKLRHQGKSISWCKTHRQTSSRMDQSLLSHPASLLIH